jgi:hypothetical protein
MKYHSRETADNDGQRECKHRYKTLSAGVSRLNMSAGKCKRPVTNPVT